jgi:LuxR family transcriptional regulator, maltose regulon positive regulatory protein
MADLFLQTKLYVPRMRSKRVSRPHLSAKLDAGVDGKLSLISAPAGFGKTTLVADWLTSPASASASHPYSWLSLDAADNDPARFMRYFSAALHPWVGQIEHAFQHLSLAAPIASLPRLEAAMTAVINAVADLPHRVVIVLDDYHVITTEALHHAIAFLLEHMPPHLHVIVISRTEPPLPLARLRAHGELTEIRSGDLQFSVEEATDFLIRVMQLNLPPDAIARLEEKTEGWIAGLQLAALSLRGQPQPQDVVDRFSGSNRQLMDFLAEEVLQHQPDEIQAFLLQTAILDRLNAQLCDAVVGHECGQRLLEHLEQHNLFLIPLDDQQYWYRYHHVFAKFLRTRLRRAHPDLAPLLHRRASDWYATNGMIEAAIDHAFAADALDRAAALIDTIAHAYFWHRGQVQSLLRWLDQVPAPARLSRPSLAIISAWALYIGGQYDQMEQTLSAIEPLLTDAHEADVQQWKGQLLMLRAEHAIIRTDVVRAEGLFQQAQALLPTSDVMGHSMVTQGLGYLYRLRGDVARADAALQQANRFSGMAGNRMTQLFALYDLAKLRTIEGRLREAERIYDQMHHLVPRSDERTMPVICLAYIGRGGLLVEWNRLEEAIGSLEQGLALSQLAGFFRVGNLVYTAMARAELAQGQVLRARDHVHQATNIARQSESPLVIAETELFQARLLLQQGDVEAAAAWADTLLRSDEHRPFVPVYLQHLEQITYGRWLLAHGQLSEAIALLEQRRDAGAAAGWIGSLIEIDILLALAEQTNHRLDIALACLTRALRAAEPAGYIRLFVDEGAPMAQLLRQAIARGIAPRYIGILQAAFLPVADAAPLLLEPLTARELTVLRLIAAGLSNQEIADQLVIAIGTVGKYTNTIFTKLGVRNRTAAVERSRVLGILSAHK